MSRQNTTESLLCHQDTYFQEGRAASEAIFDHNDTAKQQQPTYIDFLSPNCRAQVESSVVTEQVQQPHHQFISPVPEPYKVYVNYPYSSRNTKLDLLPHQRAAPVRDASVYYVSSSHHDAYHVQAVSMMSGGTPAPALSETPFMPPPPPAESTYEVLVNVNGMSMDEANNQLICLANLYIQRLHESAFYFAHEAAPGHLMSVEDPCPSDLSVFQYVTEWCREAALWWDRNFSHMQRPVHAPPHHNSGARQPHHRRGESGEFASSHQNSKDSFPTPSKRRMPAFDPPRPRSQQVAAPSFRKSK